MLKIIKCLQAETAAELDAILPAILQSSFGFRLRTAPVSTELRRGKSPRQVAATGDRAFKGEL